MQTLIIKSNYKKIEREARNSFSEISDSGNMFIIYTTEYDNYGNVKHDVFDIIKCCSSLGYEYVNTIIYPTAKNYTNCFVDNIVYIVWFCKDKKNMQFDKDSIREKHIWKDVEWGKREKNYNPKGKDPGNVWIPTEDDGNAHITKHIILSEKDIIKRLLLMSRAGKDYRFVNDENNRKKFKETTKLKEIFNNTNKTAKIYFKSSENMSDIKNKTIKSVITSPPYWNLKDYYKKGQIGQEDYKTYIHRTEKVWKECYKKNTADGVLWININIRVNNGNIVLIPKDFINSCKKIGYYYKGIFIWHKSSGIPTSANNIGDHYEFVLLFTKSKKYRIKTNELFNFNDYKNVKLNGGCIWNINRKAGSVGKKTIHPAIYPNELVKRLAIISSNEGDTILDPFLGSGTTIISSINCDRNCIGYEYNEGFKDLIKERLNKEVLSNAKIKFI